MRDAILVDAIRTPSGRGKADGQLAGIHPARLLATTLRALVERNDLDPVLIDDVIAGCVSQAGEQARNVGRTAVLGARFPATVPATTVDRQCGSSQQAVHFAAQGVMAGAYDIVVACGVESMSRLPIGTTGLGRDVNGPDVRERYAPGLVPQGISAELIAARWGLPREELDAFAARSHQLAAAAAAAGAFDDELLTVEAVDDDGRKVVATHDETIRPGTTAEGLGALRPSFADPAMAERFPEITWSITAGSSSPFTDGAAAVLITTEEVAARHGWRPRARLAAFAVVGDDPLMMLTGPIPATQRLLQRSGLTIGDIDAFEVNEAFASVPLAWLKETGADPERCNVRGGAIALGHPLGASGARLLTTLVNVLEDHGWHYGLQTMCEGGGLANATLVERLS